MGGDGFSVLFCRLYFIATSGVCLIRSGTVGFQKKLQSQKKNSVLAHFADFADKDIDYLIRLCTPINVSSNTIRCVWSGAILFCPSPRSFSYALHRFSKIIYLL